MEHLTQAKILMNRDFKGIWIPREIWLHETLSLQAKVLWAEIDSLNDRDQGGCFASDEYLMNFLGIRLSRMQEIMKELKDANLVERVSYDGRVRVIKAIHPNPENVLPPKEDIPENRYPEKRVSHTRKTGEPTYRDKSIEKKKKRESLSRIEFDLESQKFINISESDKADWVKNYVGVDVDRELFRMRQWLLDPSNTQRDGNRTFITRWLDKAFEDSKKKTKKSNLSGHNSNPSQPDLMPYNESIAYSTLHEDGVDEYVDYLKSVSDQKYYKNFQKGNYENYYIEFTQQKGI